MSTSRELICGSMCPFSNRSAFFTTAVTSHNNQLSAGMAHTLRTKPKFPRSQGPVLRPHTPPGAAAAVLGLDPEQGGGPVPQAPGWRGWDGALPRLTLLGEGDTREEVCKCWAAGTGTRLGPLGGRSVPEVTAARCPESRPTLGGHHPARPPARGPAGRRARFCACRRAGTQGRTVTLSLTQKQDPRAAA